MPAEPSSFATPFARLGFRLSLRPEDARLMTLSNARPRSSNYPAYKLENVASTIYAMLAIDRSMRIGGKGAVTDYSNFSNRFNLIS